MGEFCCKICGSKGEKYHSLFCWNLPLAADIKDKPTSCKRYSVEPVVCTECGHVQLKDTLDIDMYDNYLYTPSFSKEFQEYISEFADFIDHLNVEKRMVEIGSSNGYLLKVMQKKGWEVLGFEPSSVLANEAEQSGVPTKQRCFGDEESVQDIKKWGTPNVVIMRHVMEHLDDLNAIVSAVGDILQEGMFVIEVPWLLKIIKEKQFYAFFHEHLSYFSVTAIRNLLKKYGFDVMEVKENSLEGGSIAVYAYKGKGMLCNEKNVSAYLELEKEWCSIEKIRSFSDVGNQQISRIKNIVEAEKKSGRKVAAWGAGQRGVTLLNICGLTQADIDYIIDVNENYWWKYVLGADIQVVPPSWLNEHYVDSIIIFATGYVDEIISENSDYLRKGGQFIRIIEEM